MSVEVKYTNGEVETFPNISSYSTQDNGELDLFSAGAEGEDSSCVVTISRDRWIRVRKTNIPTEAVFPAPDGDISFDPLKQIRTGS